MSRVGYRPIEVPSNVKLNLNRSDIVVEGPRGKLNWTVPNGIRLNIEGNTVTLERENNQRQYKSLHGLSRTLIANMVIGVTEGFQKKLRVVGNGYRAEVNRQKELVLSVGYSHPVTYSPPDGIEIAVEPPESVEGQPHIPIVVSGIDKQLVGQVSATIRQVKKPEAYKPSKGIRYDGERVRMKEGKARV